MSIQTSTMVSKADFGSVANKQSILKSSSPADAQEQQNELVPFSLSSKQQQAKQQDLHVEQPRESSEQLAQEEVTEEVDEIINPYFFSTANYNLDNNKKNAPVMTILNQNNNLVVDSDTVVVETLPVQLVIDEQLKSKTLETQHEVSIVAQEPAKTALAQNTTVHSDALTVPSAAINVAPADTLVNKELNTLDLAKTPQTLYSQALLNRLNQPSVMSNTYGQAQSSSLTSEQISTQPSIGLSKLELAALSQNPQSKIFNAESREGSSQKSALVSAFSSAATAPETFEWQKEKLKEAPSEWGQRLLHVLGDKVKLQIGQQLQRAQIRLDPPNLGSIEISINIEGDKTSVSLITSNTQVRDAIAQTLEQLRQSLSQNSNTTVDVNLSDKQQQSHHQNDNDDIASNHTEMPSMDDDSNTRASKLQSDSLDLLV
ncbi:LafE [Pseudoalteromonas sp. 3J6]|uniref:flagellar hook-length control protein FliK n=1 Tax=Pseudoalteromonas sp. 3J6 TaxID=649161 RepID=UPI00177427B3|nr:flagellar hook-length control protein FliK [Pseudoalteromonas sp. 3J6]CAD2226645.1 LafE [Pseudoalteromonas sp. 3J6]